MVNMEHPGFFKKAGPFSIKKIAEVTGAEIAPEANSDLMIDNVLPLDEAKANDISFLDNSKYIPQFKQTNAAACFVTAKHKDRAPENVISMVSKQPYHCFAKALFLFFPEARVSNIRADAENNNFIHPSALVEEGAIIEPGAVIGAEARIGAGTRVSAGATIGYRTYIGRECYIGPSATIIHSLVGDNVIIHSGVSIGQDGFGFAMGPTGHLKVPQIGRVVIQDDVEIGANTTIDRGALKDTIIGEGTKIDNLVQIGHNVVIGRHCVIVAHVGISGSTELGDFVVLGGQVGVIGHAKIGSGVQVAAQSGIASDIPDGERWGGAPAQPIRKWQKEILYLRKMSEKSSS